jgi:hypothetical protein
MFVSSIWTSVSASASSTVVPYLDMTDFLKLQNGRLEMVLNCNCDYVANLDNAAKCGRNCGCDAVAETS